MAFNKKSNADNVFLREALLSALGTLSNLIKYDQVVADVKERLPLPFSINLGVGSSDRFYHDFYLNEVDCDKKIMHNYDSLPRVAVTPSGIQLNAAELTSPFGTGLFQETVEGKVIMNEGFIHMLPINIELEFTLKADTLIDAFKIWQEIIDYSLFSTIPFQFTHKNINIESLITIDVPTIDNTFEFSPDDTADDLINMTFTGSIQTNYPSLKDKYFEHIAQFQTNITAKNNNN